MLLKWNECIIHRILFVLFLSKETRLNVPVRAGVMPVSIFVLFVFPFSRCET